jgi:hypothetical protein
VLLESAESGGGSGGGLVVIGRLLAELWVILKLVIFLSFCDFLSWDGLAHSK